MLKALLDFLAGLTRMGASEATSGGEFFDEDESGDDAGAEAEGADDGAGEQEDEEDIMFDTGEEEQETPPAGDAKGGESEGEPDPEGEGAEDGGVAAQALRQAIRARLTAEFKGRGAGPKTLDIVVPSVEDLAKMPDLEDVDESDLGVIHSVVSNVVSKAFESYHANAVKPMRDQADAHSRQARLINYAGDLDRKHPKWRETHQDKMSVVYSELLEEFGESAIDTVSFLDMYIIAGGEGGKAAEKRVDSVNKKIAKDQKAAALRSQGQAGSIAGATTGTGRRRGRKDADLIEKTSRHIRKTNFEPFVIR